MDLGVAQLNDNQDIERLLQAMINTPIQRTNTAAVASAGPSMMTLTLLYLLVMMSHFSGMLPSSFHVLNNMLPSSFHVLNQLHMVVIS